MKSVVTRSLSGIVYIALIVGAILIGNWAFIALTTLFTALGVHEFHKMAHGEDVSDSRYSSVQTIDILAAMMLTLSATLVYYSSIPFVRFGFIFLLGIYMLIRAIISLYDKHAHAYREVAKSVFGVLYISLPMYMLNVLYRDNSDATHWLVLLMFIMIWLNDTGAYCFGSTFGKRRLFERLSPKKSWEGFWGGLGCCVVFGILCYFYFNYVDFGLIDWIVVGVLIGVFSTYGDLFESMLKRTVHVKDSGTLIPGHGGILDRIDSLLFVAPVTTIYYLISSFWR